LENSVALQEYNIAVVA